MVKETKKKELAPVVHLLEHGTKPVFTSYSDL